MIHFIILLLISYFGVLDCLPNLENIEIRKFTNESSYCFVDAGINIENVTCQHCDLTIQNGSYQIKTQNNQLIKVYIQHNRNIVAIPFSINCDNDELNSDIVNFTTISYSNSIMIKIKNEAEFYLIYMDRYVKHMINQTKPVAKFEIKGLRPNTLYQICVSILNERNESAKYKCIQTTTLNTSMDNQTNDNKCKGNGALNLSTIVNGTSTTRSIHWSYNLTECANVYKVIYWVENGRSECKHEIFTNKTSAVLKELERYFLYKVQVQLQNTKNSTMNMNSNVQSFYTGWAKRNSISANIQAEFVVNNMVFVKWKITGLQSSEIRQIYITLNEISSAKCVILISIQPNKLDNKCRTRYQERSNLHIHTVRNVTRKQLLNGQLYSYWSKSSFYAELKFITNDQSVHDKYKSAKINIKEDLKSCFAYCYTGEKSNGIQLTQKDGDKCGSVYSKLKYCGIPKFRNHLKNNNLIEQCVKISSYESTNSSVSGIWNYESGVIGYIALLHNQNGDCIGYNVYSKDKRSNLVDQFRNIFISCKSEFKQSIRGSKLNYKFTGLKDNTMYNIYVIPTFGKNYTGFVRIFKQRTKLFKPAQVSNVKLKAVNATAMIVTWTKPLKTNKNGPAQNYFVMIYTNNIKIKTKKTALIIGNLKECTHYCVSVFSVNEGGSSKISVTKCSKTMSPDLGSVIIRAADHNNKTISWEYMADNCPKSYRVIIWVNNNKETCHNEYKTNETSITMTNLYPKTLYKFQVEAISLEKTVNGIMMTKSKSQQFFTGNELKITEVGKVYTHFNKIENHFDFSYKTESKFAKYIYIYDVLFRDTLTNNCYRRFIIKNECIYKPYCAKIPNEPTAKENNILESEANCNKTDFETLCVKNTIKFNFTDENMSELSVSVYGQTYHGWAAIYINARGSKEYYWWICLLVLLIFMLIIGSVTFIFIHKRVFIRRSDSMNVRMSDLIALHG